MQWFVPRIWWFSGRTYIYSYFPLSPHIVKTTFVFLFDYSIIIIRFHRSAQCHTGDFTDCDYLPIVASVCYGITTRVPNTLNTQVRRSHFFAFRLRRTKRFHSESGLHTLRVVWINRINGKMWNEWKWRRVWNRAHLIIFIHWERGKTNGHIVLFAVCSKI